MLKSIQKKVNIARLQATKYLFPKGKKVSLKSPFGEGLYFWLDAKTDNGFILGFYELELAELLNKFLKRDIIFYDLGAHWGYFSLLASKMVGNPGKVYAFEPMPKNFEKLEKNLSINNCSNILAFNIAVSNKKGTINFSNSTDSFANTYIGNQKNDNPLLVKTNSLDNLVKEKKILPPDFIKIDVEGAEYDVLDGAESIIEKYNPTIHLSTHDIHLQGVDDKCCTWLTKRGYSMELFTSKKGIKDYICVVE